MTTKAKSFITYRGAVEGLQEKMYCEHLQNLINSNNKYSKRVNFIFENCKGGSPTTIVNKAKKNSINSDNKTIAIYDCDFKDDFVKSIKLAEENNIVPAYSNQTFNYFLILHKKYLYKQTTREDMYINDLKETYHLDKNSDVKNRDTIKKILTQIDLKDIKKALKNILRLNEETKKIQKEIAPNIYEQPYLNIVEFLQDVFSKIEETNQSKKN